MRGWARGHMDSTNRSGFPRQKVRNPRGKCPKDKGGLRGDRRQQSPSIRVVPLGGTIPKLRGRRGAPLSRRKGTRASPKKNDNRSQGHARVGAGPDGLNQPIGFPPLGGTFAKRQGFPRSRGKCPKDKGGSRDDRRQQDRLLRFCKAATCFPSPARRERVRVRVTGVDKRAGHGKQPPTQTNIVNFPRYQPRKFRNSPTRQEKVKARTPPKTPPEYKQPHAASSTIPCSASSAQSQRNPLSLSDTES